MEAPICEDPMGLENGEMSPNQIVVSSVLDDRESYYGKANLPLNSKASFVASAGAWVAKPKPDQYVRFNFLEPSKISGILTQGRSDSDDWVESFTVRYSPDGKTWNSILNPDGSEKVFPGNYDRDSVVKTKFDRVIQAQFLEIRPKTWKNNIAMRAEVLGCFHPYPEVTTTEAPFTTTLIPPPPYCDACPGLPEEFYDRCNPCSSGTFFDGKFCVAKAMCPCYEDGIRYETGSLFESRDCKVCECIIGGEGEAKCQEKKCPPCKDENEYSVVTSLCTCICKTCPEGTKLCPSSNYCLNETNWCNGIEDCPDDEVDCPPPTPEIPKGCPTKECPDPWVMKVQKVKGRCPSVTCELPEMTTPMPCPIPHCPLQFDIVFSHKKPGEVCPTYKCIPPITTMEPPTCPPPVCPDGYVVQESQDYEIQSTSSDDWCPHYQCIPPVTPTAPCPPPSCPQGYEVNYKDSKEPIELCPEYDCTPIITTTMCPPVECPDDLRVMYIESLDGSVCPQYSCVQMTTPYPTTTETPFPQCPPVGGGRDDFAPITADGRRPAAPSAVGAPVCDPLAAADTKGPLSTRSHLGGGRIIKGGGSRAAAAGVVAAGVVAAGAAAAGAAAAGAAAAGAAICSSGQGASDGRPLIGIKVDEGIPSYLKKLDVGQPMDVWIVVPSAEDVFQQFQRKEQLNEPQSSERNRYNEPWCCHEWVHVRWGGVLVALGRPTFTLAGTTL
ncbi:hemocytin-like [Macrobrachium nipponense]|uniref:hemocytin-like n=1 Tax=Macrobrachium nipponense TaxID=159736 RepID=UPI0030C8971E